MTSLGQGTWTIGWAEHSRCWSLPHLWSCFFPSLSALPMLLFSARGQGARNERLASLISSVTLGKSFNVPDALVFSSKSVGPYLNF